MEDDAMTEGEMKIQSVAFNPSPTLPLREVEREHILRALYHFGGNKTRTAQSLGIDPKTLWLKLKRYAMQDARGGSEA